MKTLVTGGAGFIGSTVARLLVERGFKVVVVDNLSSGYRRNLDGLDLEFIEGDIRDAALVERAARQASVIFHLAASVGNVRSLDNPKEDSEVNVIGTLNVLEAARKSRVGRLVYSSSAAIFGELLTMPIDENHPQNPDSPYGVSKLAAEKHALCFAKLNDIIVVCLRYFNVYGVNQRYDAYGNVIPIFANRLVRGQPLTIYGDGQQTRDFVNVKDVAKVNYLAATKAERSCVYNVGSAHDITINQLAQLVQEASGVHAIIEHVAPRKGEVRHCRADITKLKADLHFDPQTDMMAGLEEYFDWFKYDVRKVQ